MLWYTQELFLCLQIKDASIRGFQQHMLLRASRSITPTWRQVSERGHRWSLSNGCLRENPKVCVPEAINYRPHCIYKTVVPCSSSRRSVRLGALAARLRTGTFCCGSSFDESWRHSCCSFLTSAVSAVAVQIWASTIMLVAFSSLLTEEALSVSVSVLLALLSVLE